MRRERERCRVGWGKDRGKGGRRVGRDTERKVAGRWGKR